MFMLPDRYPSYTFYGDVDIANSASLNQRYSKISLRGVIMDIHFLSTCDYLVCTFSSQVSLCVFLTNNIHMPFMASLDLGTYLYVLA